MSLSLSAFRTPRDSPFFLARAAPSRSYMRQARTGLPFSHSPRLVQVFLRIVFFFFLGHITFSSASSQVRLPSAAETPSFPFFQEDDAFLGPHLFRVPLGSGFANRLDLLLLLREIEYSMPRQLPSRFFSSSRNHVPLPAGDEGFSSSSPGRCQVPASVQSLFFFFLSPRHFSRRAWARLPFFLARAALAFQEKASTFPLSEKNGEAVLLRGRQLRHFFPKTLPNSFFCRNPPPTLRGRPDGSSFLNFLFFTVTYGQDHPFFSAC